MPYVSSNKNRITVLGNTRKMAYVELLFMDEKDSINKVCKREEQRQVRDVTILLHHGETKYVFFSFKSLEFIKQSCKWNGKIKWNVAKNEK